MKFKLAHVSDIHFFQACYSPTQFFNRRFLGNFNYLFSRRHKFDSNLIYNLSKKLKSNGITSLLISGDLTCTASKKEFDKVISMIKHLKNEGFTVYAFPGNHDVYTRAAHREKSFYKELSHHLDFYGDYSLNLIDHGVAAYKLPHNTHLMLLDATTFNRGINANGHFSTDLERNFKALLMEIPANGSIILSAHFPYCQYKKPKGHMIYGDRLEALIKNDERIKLYLHGHRHKPQIEKRETHLVVDSGSLSVKQSASYSLVEFCENQFTSTLYNKEKEKNEQETIRR